MRLAMKVALNKVKNVALKVADHTLLGGAISKTTGTDLSPQGKIPYMEIAASLIPVILLVSVLAGLISVDQLKELLKLF
jgi:hypothetical protein